MVRSGLTRQTSKSCRKNLSRDPVSLRARRSTIDMIFLLKQLKEKCREQRRLLYLCFIDPTKAFDMVSRSGLFALLQKIGCPPKLFELIIAFHEGMHENI